LLESVRATSGSTPFKDNALQPPVPPVSQPTIGSKEGSLLRVESCMSSSPHPPSSSTSPTHPETPLNGQPSIWRLESYVSGNLGTPTSVQDQDQGGESSSQNDGNSKVLNAPQGWVDWKRPPAPIPPVERESMVVVDPPPGALESPREA
jgi:hypothetical protein